MAPNRSASGGISGWMKLLAITLAIFAPIVAIAIVDFIVTELSEKHPKHVNLEQEWIFNNAGGAMGAMYVIHASITEYLIIFGTTIGTEGHTGRHTADDYFNILTGTQTAYTAGTFEPEVYPAGSVHHLRRGTVKQYRMPEGCFALDTLDLPTLWRTTYVTGREMIGNLLIGKF
ncbi:unnamed protein product [Parascedosporium putredinis]|uniref:C-8 sterol isomerase n=1 Tax=Parascedosporium putredinis TaxID=1442378 RepID=A0A9P1M5P3_9PEZI|nr:unnamed protein product [Parascedosporium putredinis]CAI7987490.1 unnamed protein product [Parascedosporium putredinis]